MIVIGITGGIGCGKTTVSNIIRNMGFNIISTDDRAKELMVIDQEIISNIKSVFGNSAYLSNGSLNSEYISKIVFGDDEKNQEALQKLNSIVHPKIIDDLLVQIEEFELKGEQLLFVESALIYEAMLEDGFDYVLVVDSEEEIAVSRVIQRSGLTKEQVLQRMKSQIPNSEKIQYADFVIENNRSISELENSINMIMAIIKALVE